MNKVRITVLETPLNAKLIREYAVEGFGPCPVFQAGEEVMIDGFRLPEKFCGEAWTAIKHYVFALQHGADIPFFAGHWMKDQEVAIVTCNDGLRPVTFKLEAVEE